MGSRVIRQHWDNKSKTVYKQVQDGLQAPESFGSTGEPKAWPAAMRARK